MSALLADYHAALADEAAFRGITEAELRASIKQREQDEGEDELRPLDVELRDQGWGSPQRGAGSKRARAAGSSADGGGGGGGGAAPSPSSSPTSPAQLSPAKHARATAAALTLRKAFHTPRPAVRAPPPPPPHEDDELLDALDRAIAATPASVGGGGRGSAGAGAGRRSAGGGGGRAGTSGAAPLG
ncbi:hypothetical protein JCM9279_002024 [Rhodotorula babjevae]